MSANGAQSREASETGRVETFSDSVFAIAATLLVLTIAVPAVEHVHTTTGLRNALLHQWPNYVAFVISFLSILIMWFSHHNIFNAIRRVDHTFLLINGLVLLGITATPFSTALLAQYFGHPGEKVAAEVYSAVALFIALSYNALWLYASRGRRLLSSSTSDERMRLITSQYRWGPIAFAAALVLAFFSAIASVTMFVVILVYFALPLRANRALGEVEE